VQVKVGENVAKEWHPLFIPGGSCSNMKLRIGRDTPDGGTSNAVGVAGCRAAVTS
jgi:hypothetical protein